MTAGVAPSRDIAALLAIMRALRDPVSGCAWDIAQDFASIAPFTLEEAYEVVDAIERGDLVDLKDELGDLLLQVVFHAQMAQERGAFGFGDVVEAITAKLIRRHPHVFAAESADTPAKVKVLWDAVKAQEKASRAAARAAAGAPEEPSAGGALAGAPLALPALTRAVKLQSKASAVGFDWGDAAPVFAKIREEIDELETALKDGEGRDAVDGELGDVLFSIANLARLLDVDPEAATRATNDKFTRRFAAIEQALAATGRRPEDASLAEMDALWDQAKARERSP